MKAQTRVGSLTLNPGENYAYSSVIDTANGVAYFGMYVSPGLVVKVRLSDFTRVGALTLNTGEDYLYSAVIDAANGYAYFGTDTVPGIIVKVRLSDLTRVGSLTLDTGEDYLNSAVIDAANGYAYFGTATSPIAVVKIRLSDFTRVGALALNSGEDYTSSAVIDTANGFAYFGTYTLPGIVVKVRLSDFTRVGALTLNTGEFNLVSAVIDAANGYAYFGTYTIPGRVVKVRLSDFIRVGALTLNAGEDRSQSAVIDTVNGFAYFGTGMFDPGIIVTVRLSDLTRVGVLTLNAGEYAPNSAVIDTANGFAYFAMFTFPAIVVKVRLNALSPSCISPPPSLVSWWPGDGNVDDAVDGNDGTLQNGATFAAGKVGQALSFDGLDDYVSVPDSSSLRITGPVTIDLWVNPNTNNNQGPLVFKQRTIFEDGTLKAYEVGVSGGNLYWQIGDGTVWTTLPYGISWVAGTWHHIAVTWDGTTGPGSMKIYQDGTLVASTSAAVTSIQTNAYPLRIGGGGSFHSADVDFFDGLVDEVEIYNRSLTDSEVQAIFSAETAGKCIHDVAVTGVAPSRGFAYTGIIAQPIKVNVIAANRGRTTETFTVTARANSTTIGTQAVTVPAGASTVVTFNWNTTSVARGRYILSAEASSVTEEANLANNDLTSGMTFTVRLAGDVNNDCALNFLDLGRIGSSFLKSSGQAGFDAESDINNDGAINFIDLGIVGSNFLKQCT